MGDGPTADAGAVGFEVEPTMGFTGGGAVGGRGLGGEQFGDQGSDFGGQCWLVIPAGPTGRLGLGLRHYVEDLLRQLRPYAHRFMLSASCNTSIRTLWKVIQWFRDDWKELAAG